MCPPKYELCKIPGCPNRATGVEPTYDFSSCAIKNDPNLARIHQFKGQPPYCGIVEPEQCLPVAERKRSKRHVCEHHLRQNLLEKEEAEDAIRRAMAMKALMTQRDDLEKRLNAALKADDGMLFENLARELQLTVNQIHSFGVLMRTTEHGRWRHNALMAPQAKANFDRSGRALWQQRNAGKQRSEPKTDPKPTKPQKSTADQKQPPAHQRTQDPFRQHPLPFSSNANGKDKDARHKHKLDVRAARAQTPQQAAQPPKQGATKRPQEVNKSKKRETTPGKDKKAKAKAKADEDRKRPWNL